MKKKRQGFTLVELLAVIVVLAVIMVIAIPAVLEATNAAKKKSFFLYAQSLQSKAVAQYTQDLDLDKELRDCAVYSIEKDLYLSDTGKYQGWVQVKRVPVSSGYKIYSVTLEEPKGFEYVKYCTGKGTSCTPNETHHFIEGDKKIAISKKLKDGYVVCANYQYVENGKLKTSSTKCDSSGEETLDTYDYSVTVSLIDDSYSADRVLMSEKMSQDAFYGKINKENMTIVEPVCGSGTAKTITRGHKSQGVTNVTVDTDLAGNRTTEIVTSSTKADKTSHKVTSNKTTTTRKTEHVVSTSTTRSKETAKTTSTTTRSTGIVTEKSTTVRDTDKITTTTTTRGTGTVTEKSTTTRSTDTLTTSTTTRGTGTVTERTTTTRNTDTLTTTTTTRGTGSVTEVTTTTRPTTVLFTTTVNPKDQSLLLFDMQVRGHDIGFDTYKFYYDLYVPYGTDSITIDAKGYADETEITIAGHSKINPGKNDVIVKLFDTLTGKSSYYRIYVYEAEKPNENVTQPTRDPYADWTPESGLPDPRLDESKAILQYLSVAGYNLHYDSTVKEYTLEIEPEETELKISYRTYHPKTGVSIYGNKDLDDGDVIKISVTSANGYYTNEYTLNIKKAKRTTTTTKILQGVIVGLAVLAGTTAIAVKFVKDRKTAIVQQDDVIEPSNLPPSNNN